MLPEIHKVYEAVNTFGSMLYSNNIIPSKRKFEVTYSYINKKHLNEQEKVKKLNILIGNINLVLDFYMEKMSDMSIETLRNKKDIFHFSLILFDLMKNDFKKYPHIRITNKFDLLVEKLKDVYEAIEVYTDAEAMDAINDYINGKKENFVD